MNLLRTFTLKCENGVLGPGSDLDLAWHWSLVGTCFGRVNMFVESWKSQLLQYFSKNWGDHELYMRTTTYLFLDFRYTDIPDIPPNKSIHLICWYHIGHKWFVKVFWGTWDINISFCPPISKSLCFSITSPFLKVHSLWWTGATAGLQEPWTRNQKRQKIGEDSRNPESCAWFRA